MAEENTRPGRGRKKADANDSAGKKKKATTGSEGRRDEGAKTTTPRTRRPKLVPEPPRETIAEHAYLLWERGEPGDETEHWLRAEAELRAA